MLEYWNVGKNQKKSLIIIPLFQYSIVPVVHFFLCVSVVKLPEISSKSFFTSRYQMGWRPAKLRPAVSLRPHMRFMAWTACPAAPFIRLSMAEMTTSLVPSSSKPMSQ